jgi:hypothetical protein
MTVQYREYSAAAHPVEMHYAPEQAALHLLIFLGLLIFEVLVLCSLARSQAREKRGKFHSSGVAAHRRDTAR